MSIGRLRLIILLVFARGNGAPASASPWKSLLKTSETVGEGELLF